MCGWGESVYGVAKIYILIVYFLFLNVYLFIFERQRERETETERDRERERESQAGSMLPAQSPMWGLIWWTMRSWPEPNSRVRRLTEWATQAPLNCSLSMTTKWSLQSNRKLSLTKKEKKTGNGKCFGRGPFGVFIHTFESNYYT